MNTITPSEQEYLPDAVEALVPDVAAARRLFAENDAQYEKFLEQRIETFKQHFSGDETNPERFLDCLKLATARMAVRHGSWGKDYHHYHNEGHIHDIMGRRMDTLLSSDLSKHLDLKDLLMLALFSTTHDLRQREKHCGTGPVGCNEKASAIEGQRIMAVCGFDRETDAELFRVLELMIHGSTFVVQVKSTDEQIGAEAAHSGGALAGRLVAEMKSVHGDWRTRNDMKRRVRLALIASDLDTANVAEEFVLLARSAADLCIEREWRAGRDLDSNESARPALEFLTGGQETYFFHLHGFDSRIGIQAFGKAKRQNGPSVVGLSRHLRQNFPEDEIHRYTGEDILNEFLDHSLTL